MQLYFKHDICRILFKSYAYARAHDDVIEFKHNDSLYFAAVSSTYTHALEYIIMHSTQLDENLKGDYQMHDFDDATMEFTNSVIDIERGDGFTLLMIPFNEWHKYLSIGDIPEVYQ